MKRAILIIAIALCAVAAAGQPLDIASWDASAIPGYDDSARLRFTFKADPKSGDMAFVVHAAMTGYIFVLQDIFVRRSDGTCLVGNRTVADGASKMVYREIRCDQFQRMYDIWRAGVKEFLLRNKSGPLNG